ncbi:MAG: hypothetical protein PVSMB1_01360 [Gemmatimonadaceae bacterium]
MLDHMTGDDSIQRAIWDGGQPVDIEIDVQVCFGTMGQADKLRPVLVSAAFHRTIGIADTRARSDGKRFMTRADLKDIAREGSPDDTARVLSHSRQTTM